MKTTTPTLEELRDAIAGGSPAAIRGLCGDLHPVTIADLLKEFRPDEILAALAALDEEQRVAAFAHLPLQTQRDLTALLEPEELANLIARMPHDERVDLLHRLTPEESEVLLRLVAKAERDDILKLSHYPEGTVGAVMTSDYALVGIEQTAEQAIQSLRLAAPEKETIYSAYVVDGQRRLVGYVPLRDLILASPRTPVEKLVHRDVPFLRASDDQEEAARVLSKYDLLAVPVINGGDAMVGIVTFDDALDVAEQEATEDMHRMGGSNLATVSLKEATVSLLVRKRIPWLMTLVFMNIFSGAGIAYFEGTIEAAVALVFFLPLLIDSGGNAGSQASTLMVRSLATGDVMLRDWLGLLRKEVLVAVAMGVLMGAAVSAIGVFRAGPEVAVVVAMTMVCVVIVGSVLGMSLPFLLQRFKFDPATASAPLITSLADIAGVLIYFSIATWYLGLGAPPAA